jgi:transposase
LRRITKTPSHPAKIVARARIILLWHAGMSRQQIARFVDCAPATASNWKSRWRGDAPAHKRDLLAWLRDRWRCGAPSRFSLDQRAQIIGLACENTTDHALPTTRWTSADLRAVAIELKIVPDISRRQVSRILREADLKPHRSRYWLNAKRDPQKKKKIAAINQVYREAPAREKQGVLTFCLDEMTGVQALERIVPDKPSRPGLVRCVEYEYKRHGTLCLLGAFRVASGELSGLILPRRTEADFVQLIEAVVGAHPQARGFRFVLDNLNTHQSEQLVRYVAAMEGVPPGELGVKNRSGILKNMKTRAQFLSRGEHRVVFHYTPKHASWMNQIEIAFGILSRKALRHGSFPSQAALKQRIADFIEYFNRVMARPFKWTYGNKPLAT